MRFLERTQTELAQMRACLPEGPLVIEPVALAHIERMAAKISSAAEAFGFPEIGVVAGAIELLAQVPVGRTMGDRLAFMNRLTAQISTLEVHVEYELAERTRQQVPDDLPMSAFLPRSALGK